LEISSFNEINVLIGKNFKLLERLKVLYMEKDLNQVVKLFHKFNQINGEILKKSNVFNFASQAYVIVSKQKELSNGNVSSAESLKKWVEFQSEYLKNLKNISDISLKILNSAKTVLK
jgi:hypothetical protein